MKRIDLKAFRKANNLTQEQLGDYLGIKKSFISTIESGKDPMPKAKLSKLLSNPYNWDTSMLTSQEALPDVSPTENAGAYEMLINHLKQEIKDKDALITELRKEIWSLQQELDLAGKREIASVVGGSSVADAV